ncbi:unnamed protein product [Protopolystoma xenopodis]|uniref:Uncharacterized protein n=1 Tax=Protopolystoma xenopodis TaxID=117903 RepID=A0A448X3J7_9PLAT|nr:unnamed protein product [Protopolystoma xenopodis]
MIQTPGQLLRQSDGLRRIQEPISLRPFRSKVLEARCSFGPSSKWVLADPIFEACPNHKVPIGRRQRCRRGRLPRLLV